MISEFKNHKLAYLVLFLMLFIFVSTFLHFWPDRDKQRVVILTMATFYFVWGVIVHRKHNNINLMIIFEYLAVSVLAGSILTLLTF